MQTMAHVNLDNSAVGGHTSVAAAAVDCSLCLGPVVRAVCFEVAPIRGPCHVQSRPYGYETTNFVNGLLLGS